MTSKNKTWYKEIWSLNIKNQSWTEDTKTQIDFLRLLNFFHIKGQQFCTANRLSQRGLVQFPQGKGR